MEINEIYQKILEAENYRVLALPFILMVIDFATGIFHAWNTGHLKSYKMRDGLNKKFAEVTMIVTASLLYWAINIPKYIVLGLVGYVALMEFISICENLDKMGVPMLKIIKSGLRNAEYKIQNEEKKEADGE